MLTFPTFGLSLLVNVVSERPLKKVLASQRDWALCGELTMALGINHLVYYQIKIVFPVDWLPPVHDALENKGIPFLKRSVCLLQIMRIRKKFILLHKVFKTNKWRVVNLNRSYNYCLVFECLVDIWIRSLVLSLVFCEIIQTLFQIFRKLVLKSLGIFTFTSFISSFSAFVVKVCVFYQIWM